MPVLSFSASIISYIIKENSFCNGMVHVMFMERRNIYIYVYKMKIFVSKS